MGVVGVHYKGDAFPYQCVGNRVDLDLGGVRDLFDTSNDKHGSPYIMPCFLA
jgi:hypothetical protein